MQILFRFLFSCIFLFLSTAFGRALWVEGIFFLQEWKTFLPVEIGVAVYLLVQIVLFLLGRSLEFWETFCHELNHTVFALLSFRRVESFFAHAENGGKVTFSGMPNPAIALAPYSFPLFAFCAASISCLLIPEAKLVVQIAVGFFLAFHLGSVFRDARPRQTDLQIYGYPFSYSAIFFFNLFWIPFIAETAIHGFRGGLAWTRMGLEFAWEWILTFGSFLCSALS